MRVYISHLRKPFYFTELIDSRERKKEGINAMRNLNSCANNMFTLRNTGQSQCDGTQTNDRHKRKISSRL